MAGVALLAGLLLGRAIPIRVELDLWPAGLSAAPAFVLSLDSWTWALLVCVLGFGLAHALTARGDLPSASRAASLGYLAALGLAVPAKTIFLLTVTWTLAILTQVWVIRAASASRPSLPTRQVRAGDLLTLLLLMSAFGAGGLAASVSRQLAAILLGLAALLRVGSAIRATDESDSDGAFLVFPAAASGLAALGWGWGEFPIGRLYALLVGIGTLLLTAGWFSGWLAGSRNVRASAWVVGIGGLGLLAAASAPTQTPASLGLTGIVLVLAGTLAVTLPLGRLGARIASALAVLIAVGFPGLVGIVLLGILVPDGSTSFLGWAAVVGIGLLASTFLKDALRPQAAAREEGGFLAAAAGGLVAVLAAILYFRLHELAPPPVAYAPVIAAAVAFIAVLVLGRVPDSARTRMARAFRWPAYPRFARDASAAGRPALGFLRGVRDVLEGDASLLWAMVVVVVGLLLLQVIPS